MALSRLLVEEPVHPLPVSDLVALVAQLIAGMKEATEIVRRLEGDGVARDFATELASYMSGNKESRDPPTDSGISEVGTWAQSKNVILASAVVTRLRSAKVFAVRSAHEAEAKESETVGAVNR